MRDGRWNRSGSILGALKGPKVRSEFGSEQRFRRYERLKFDRPAYLHKAVKELAKLVCRMTIGSGSINLGQAEPIRKGLG